MENSYKCEHSIRCTRNFDPLCDFSQVSLTVRRQFLSVDLIYPVFRLMTMYLSGYSFQFHLHTLHPVPLSFNSYLVISEHLGQIPRCSDPSCEPLYRSLVFNGQQVRSVSLMDCKIY